MTERLHLHVEHHRHTPEIRFFYMLHGKTSSVRHLAGQPGWADTILLEYVGDVPSYRENLQSELNLVLKRDKGLSTGDQSRRAWLKSEYSASKHYWKRLVYALEGSGKTLQLIDIDASHSRYLDNVDCQRAAFQTVDLMWSGEFEEALKSHKKAFELDVAWCDVREKIVEEQIIRAARNPNAKSLAVLQGAVHTPTYHTFAKNHPEFTVRMRYDREHFSYFPSDQLLVRMRQAPGVRIADVEYKRSLLYKHIFCEAIAPGRLPTEDELFDIAHLASSLSTQSVETVWTFLQARYKYEHAKSPEKCFHQAALKVTHEVERLVAKKRAA